MCVSTSSAPTPPPRVPEAAQAPSVSTADAQTASERDTKRRRAAAGGDSRSTILTGPRGAQDGGTVVQKTLLGA